jgi:hypothetical protein
MKILPSKPRWLRVTAKIVLSIVAILFLRTVLGLGLAWCFYRTTPNFHDHAREFPADEIEFEHRLPDGESSLTLPYVLGSVDIDELAPQSPRSKYSREGGPMMSRRDLEIELDHGSERLLSFHQWFDIAIDREAWDHVAFRANAPVVQTAQGFRSVTVLTLPTADELVGEESGEGGKVTIDVLLLAGEGPDEVRVRVEEGGHPERVEFPEPDLSTAFLRAAAGLMHPSKSPPAEGIVHHFRQKLSFDWTIEEDRQGSGGPGWQFTDHWTNAGAYSYGFEVRQPVSMNGSGGGNITTGQQVEFTWGDVIW